MAKIQITLDLAGDIPISHKSRESMVNEMGQAICQMLRDKFDDMKEVKSLVRHWPDKIELLLDILDLDLSDV